MARRPSPSKARQDMTSSKDLSSANADPALHVRKLYGARPISTDRKKLRRGTPTCGEAMLISQFGVIGNMRRLRRYLNKSLEFSFFST